MSQRFTFYDQIHTTGMDIKQSLDACAAVTLGKDMTLRDLAQGCWRMRGLGQGQTVQLLIVNEVLELVREAEEASQPKLASGDVPHQGGAAQAVEPATHIHLEVATQLNAVVAWLVTNSMKSERLQQLQLFDQSVASVWRKQAFDLLLSAKVPKPKGPTGGALVTRFHDPLDEAAVVKALEEWELPTDVNKGGSGSSGGDGLDAPFEINMRVSAPGGFVQSPLKALKGMQKAHAAEP